MCAQKSVTVIASDGQFFLTFFTSDTAKLTGSRNCFTFGVGATGYTDLFVIWYKLDQMTRTFCNAFTAGLTCFLIYDCNAIYYMNSVKWTYFYAASNPIHPYVQFFAPLPGMKAIISQSSTPVYSYFTVVLSQVPAHFTKQPDVRFLLLPVP